MSIKALSEYTRYAKYSRYSKEKKRRETWDEQVNRVFDMHEKHLGDRLEGIKDDFYFAKNMMLKKRILGSQRALQFGGDPILQKNEKIYNCLRKDTKFITNSGVKSFTDFNDGDNTVVLTHNGNWKNAIVRCYGTQKLYKYTFGRNSAYYDVWATRNHRWILSNGSETTDIKIGDILVNQPSIFEEFDYDSASIHEKMYWAYGLVFGDGTKVKNSKGEYAYSMIRLCGKDKCFNERFEELGFNTNTTLSLKGDFYAYTGTYLKTLPDINVDGISLVRAFVRGFLDADGAKNRNVPFESKNIGTYSRFISIQQSSIESREFIENIFPCVGAYIISSRKVDAETNFGKHDAVSYRLSCGGLLSKHNVNWKVKDISNDFVEEDVWCLEVEDDHSFVLPNGIVTGNCSASYADRVRCFQEFEFLLLCGCGVGMSVQKHHINKLPTITKRIEVKKKHIVEDSIEGWADAIGVLVSSYFSSDQTFPEYYGFQVEFDYSKIRPEGSPISWGGKAPGPKGLMSAIEKITGIFEKCLEEGRDKLKPIEVYDILMHESDACLSGGIRRSATIMLFSPDDSEMATAKTGDWFIKNPQRGRSNNSAVLLRDSTTKEQFAELMKSVKDYGEPGFIWTENTEVLFNPCCEISLYGYDEFGNSGFEFCNLTTINAKKCKTEEDFLEACKASAILGTIQASYDKFPYLGEVSERIVRREALLGCSMTGIMDNPSIALNPDIQRKGAEVIKSINKDIAKKIGINQAARTTTIKPEGSASCLLGSSSGIHPNHAKRYIRRVQANKNEFPAQYFKMHNERAVEESVWSANKTDWVLSFLCEVPDGAKLKNSVSAIELLESVKLTQQNWVESGTNHDLSVQPWLRHNVSNTITVSNEWKEVENFIYENRKWFAGISLLPASGDLDYPQAPFTTVLTHKEIIEQYGEGALFASGLIVDGLASFNNNLWAACDAALGIGETLLEIEQMEEPVMPHKNGYTDKQWALKLVDYAHQLQAYNENNDKVKIVNAKIDWVRRFKQFSQRYCNGDNRKTSHLLKYVHNWKLWLDLKREYNDVDWSMAVEEDFQIDVTTLGAQACSGNNCEVK
jgi:ribonucleoside-diphosphate reductase alpha chain